MKYQIEPSYETTTDSLAVRLCDILVGREVSPVSGHRDKPIGSWDVTGGNNHWLHPTPEAGVWVLSCRSPLSPELERFLAVEVGAVVD